jgi:hypothetical protein
MDENVTRRAMALIFGSLGLSLAHAQTQKAGTGIHQEVDFKTTPQRIYEALLLDTKQFTAFTKASAEIEQPFARSSPPPCRFIRLAGRPSSLERYHRTTGPRKPGAALVPAPGSPF